MKLEKREITLNERDSLTDVVCLDKVLLFAYQEGLAKMKRKETAKALIRQMQETAEELFFIAGIRERESE
jgi:hypothetical protein